MQSYDTMTDVVICHGVERRRRSHPCDKPRPNTKRSNQYVIQGTVSNSREIARMILLECPIS
jgi:hypothetical protein